MTASSGETVSLPYIVAIPGVSVRRFRGETDYAAMLAVRESCRERDRLDPYSAREPLPTLDDIAQSFAGMPVNSPDVLVAEEDGAMVGYGRLTWWTEEDGTGVYLARGWVRPEARGRGIGSALLVWGEARARAHAAGQPDAARMILAANASTTERDATVLLLDHGYAVVRRLSELRLGEGGLPDASALPDGVTLKPVQPEQYRAIYDGWKAAFAGHWGQIPASEEDYAEFLADYVERSGRDTSLWRIAWHGDEAVGLVICSTRGPAGFVDQVGVRSEWQRRGIARALLLGALCELRRRGIREIRIYTDAEDGRGAKSLYQRAGFAEIKEYRLYRKPHVL